MTLSYALNAAVSGLSAVSRGIQAVSTNVANAATDDYGVRSLVLASRPNTSGVRIASVDRALDQGLLELRRQAHAGAAGTGMLQEFWQALDRQIGTPDHAGSLTQRISGLAFALQDAAANSESGAKLANVRRAADAIVQKIQDTESYIQKQRMAADQAIGQNVESLNAGLQKVEALNKSIRRAVAEGRDALGLMDMRQAVVSSLSEIVPITEIKREGGRIELMTTGGLVLLDHKPAVFGFAPARALDSTMTAAGGELSGLTVNGHEISLTSTRIAGGTLAAAIDMRDTLAPDAQMRLDTLAQDLVNRFADPLIDPTLPTNQPGLFTIDGAVATPVELAGSAGRLKLNPLIAAANGEADWRLRSGMGATTPAPTGETTLLLRLGDALETRKPLTPGSPAHSVLGHTTAFASHIGSASYSAEISHSYAAGRDSELLELIKRGGVDTDAEMQKLLRLEQAYAANARVIQAVDEMMRTILEI
ncbi:flagellar hook-associated protein FlgK [Roseicitreum antarcticum]|uniref:Flagellar hook-associated protein 1 n=1 Tax=Roseicitreum antarcticum TaxID=564137 RepID=A0A1H2RB90_9RHOB|nr:flagellar hook-associated protein FlgK [Roseicitreum antarcticum]SDW15939.1 flagellar hook-associated protein 1 FlgK [Roseicitreum antarcticum]